LEGVKKLYNLIIHKEIASERLPCASTGPIHCEETPFLEFQKQAYENIISLKIHDPFSNITLMKK
jgi:hypothetical protein